MSNTLDVSHIKNADAAEFLIGLRREFTGVQNVYCGRYMTALSIVCKSNVGTGLVEGKVMHVVNFNGHAKNFKTAGDAGRYMEAKIEYLFSVGVNLNS
jgi:hypothetical protein